MSQLALVMRHGGTTNRPGTSFVGEVKDSTKATRLIPFIFNDDQTHILEIGHEYARIITGGAHIKAYEIPVTGITNANPGVVTTSIAHAFNNGDDIDMRDVFGMDELEGRRVRVKNKTATTFEMTDLEYKWKLEE